MLKANITAFSIILKLLRDNVNEDGIDSKPNNKEKNLFIFCVTEVYWSRLSYY